MSNPHIPISPHRTVSPHITVSPRWILRHDEHYGDQHCLYNIDDKRLIYLNKGLYSIIKLFYYRAIPFDEVKGYLTRNGVEFNYSDHNEFEQKLNLSGLFMQSDSPMHNKRAVLTDLSNYRVPVCSSPMDVEIHLTHNCNLKCLHCFQSSELNSNKTKLLSTDDWERIFSQMEEANVLSIIISGGEPFMYPNANEILRELATKRLSIAILSNGLMVNSKNIDIFTNKNVSITISLDGNNESTHEYLRGKNTFAPTMRSIRLLADMKAHMAIAHTLHKQNFKFFEIFVNFLISEGIEALSVNFVEPEGRAALNKNLILSYKEESDMRKKITEICEKYSDKIMIDFSSFSEKSQISGFGDGNKIFCSAGTKRLAISSDGSVYPCLYAFNIDALKVGDLKKESLMDIWTAHTDIWKQIRGGINISDIETCKSCHLNTCCALRNCRIKYYHKNNNLLSKPDNCILDKENFFHSLNVF